MSSRGSISGTQRISRSLKGGARQAIAANMRRTIAPCVIESTIEYPELAAVGKAISVRRCRQARLIGQVVLLPGQQFFAVASKFAPRYYIVAKQNGQWTCSCKDPNTARLVLSKFEAFRALYKAKRAEQQEAA